MMLLYMMLSSDCTDSFKTVAVLVCVVKVVSATFLLVCFAYLKESTCEARKNVLFHVENSFRS